MCVCVCRVSLTHVHIPSPGRYGDVVWEGGGHVGSHTVALGRLVGEAGHVYSYEAHPTTRAVLGANIVMNGLQSVVNVIPMGVGETNGVIEIGGGCSNVCKDSGVECVDACDEGSKQVSNLQTARSEAITLSEPVV